jgi:hypothetical protein
MGSRTPLCYLADAVLASPHAKNGDLLLERDPVRRKLLRGAVALGNRGGSFWPGRN